MTPLYLLDSYPSTLYGELALLTALVTDNGWLTSAIQAIGVEAVLATMQTAARAAAGTNARVNSSLTVVQGQAHNLRDQNTNRDLGFVARQLCLQALELGEEAIADATRTRLLSSGTPGLVPCWTTLRTSPAFLLELGRLDVSVEALAVLADGRVITGGHDGRLLIWNPVALRASPVQLGQFDDIHVRNVDRAARRMGYRQRMVDGSNMDVGSS